MDQTVIDNIYKDILEISDIQLQKSYWLGGNISHISSYTEVNCRLFDDSDFGNFVDNKVTKIGLNDKIIIQLKIFKEMLLGYKEKSNDVDIIEDPEWQKITKQAQLIIELWKNERILLQH